MKNTLFLLFAFLLLGGVSYWYVNRPDDSLSTMSYVEDRKFAIENPDDVGKIFIADRLGNSNTFVRKGNYWELNGRYKTNEIAINKLLSTMKRLELSYIPPKAAIPNIVDVLGSNGIKVEIYDLENKKLKAYYIGGLTNNEEGTYMIIEGAEQPYVMKLPAFIGGLRARYYQPEVAWRDRDLFGNEIEDIKYISMEYPKQKNKSFILERKDVDFDVRPFYEVTTAIDKPMKKGISEAYLVGFERYVAENIINDHPGRDSISSMIPFAILTVKNNKGETQTARFHPLRPMGLDGTPMADEEVMTSSTAVEKYHVDHSKGDYFLIQQRNIGRAFWAYDSFFEK